MSETIHSNKRIAKNTMYLYIRMLLTMAIGLYASRVVLQVLGESDYGLYNVVGGVLTMFTMVSSALQVGTQRFLSFAIGEGDESKLKQTFSIALFFHIIIALIVLLLAESIGLWFLNNYLNIPHGRENAAHWIYQFTIISFVFSFLQVPFQSCIIAHEKMSIYAYMSIYETVTKLFIVLILPYIPLDKLISYGALLLLLNITSILIYNCYCRKQFLECRFSIKVDKKMAKDLVSYSGWNILGGSANVFSNQGINILLNIFCGTIINAARGLASSISSLLFNFVMNFQMAANPQIVKLYAAKELDKFHKLITDNCKIVTYLFLVLAIPAFLEIDFLLELWLGEFPKYTNIFIKISLMEIYLRTVNQPILYSIHASGKMKWQNIISSSLLFLTFPISFFVLKAGFSPVLVYIITTILWGANNIVCLYFSHIYTRLSIKETIIKVYLNTFIGGAIMFIVPFFLQSHFQLGWSRFIITCISSIFTSVIVIYYLGITKEARHFILYKIKKMRISG